MKEYIVKDHAPSLLPEGEWKLVWNDEFDGKELDRDKWDYRLCMMGKRHPAWTDKGVHLDGKGNCVFTALTEDGRPVSSQLQTGYNFMDEPVKETVFGHDHLQWNIGKLKEDKYLKKFGYFECRCKLQQKLGWWSAFWLQSPVIGSTLDGETSGIECDIMESFKPGECIFHANHYAGYAADHKQINTGKGAVNLDPDEYHTFAVYWSPRGYTYYIDGEEDGHVDGPVSHIPEFIMLSTEVQGYRGKDHCASEAAKLAVGDEFIVDYVRVFDSDEYDA